MAARKSLRKHYNTAEIETRGMGQAVDDMMNTAKNGRKAFERRWYDNNWFDDGHHFRYLSRSQNKIIDLSERATIYQPMRAIPKASRQIRGVVNLLISNDLVPVIYPEKIEQANYEDEREFAIARQEAKIIARRTGHWVEEEFEKQEIKEKLAQMGILTSKHHVSYLQLWPDAVEEKINTAVRDAFDVFLIGEVNELEDSPFVILAHPKFISEIKANELFDEEQKEKINPDNRQASTEIKEAYMKARYGREFIDDSSATLILKEAYIKEHLNKDNIKKIRKQENGKEILADREEGDTVIRQVFVAGNIWLRDEYLELPEYPFVDLRFEPGPMYGIPLIERFIPSNKSLDTIVSRIERYAHTMTTGTWLKRQGEQFNLSNQAGGQIIEYKSVPPQQGQMAPLPQHLFNYIDLINSFIEEQGVTTTTLGKIPRGVESGKAIESLKESEFANLVTANRMFKKTIRRIAQKFLDMADRYFVSPQTIARLEKGEPQYFDVIGKRAMDKREELKVPVEGEVVPISKEYRVDIEVQSGLAYTREGQKAAAKELGDYMVQLAQLGLLPPAAISKYLEVLLQAYQFGPASEFMEEIERFMKEGGGVTDAMMDKIKVALAEVIKDTGIAEDQQDETRDVEKAKLGAAQAISDIMKAKGEQ